MKPFDNPKKKTYCYKNDCNVVESGFQDRHNFFYVCTVCKEEVSENLKNTIQSRNKQEPDTSMSEVDEYQLGFPFLP